MKVIAFFGQKGGGGKSTDTVHAATEAERAGERPIIIDLDPQGSTSSWGDKRKQETPFVLYSPVSLLQRALDKAEGDGFTIAVLDCPGYKGAESAAVARAADMIIIPVRPSAFDVALADASAKMARAGGKEPYFLLNGCHSRRPDQANAVAEYLSKLGRVAPVQIGNRVDFEDAIASGRAVSEFKPKGKAAHEIKQLWLWIKEELCHPTTR